jgi:hypothetical protein
MPEVSGGMSDDEDKTQIVYEVESEGPPLSKTAATADAQEGPTTSSSSSSQEPVVAEVVEAMVHKVDWWEETDECWIRHHVKPRKTLFTPVDVVGAPPKESISNRRRTEVTYVGRRDAGHC